MRGWGDLDGRGRDLVHPDDTIKAAGLSHQGFKRYLFYLELAGVWWELSPPAHAALVNPKSGSGCRLGFVVTNYV